MLKFLSETSKVLLVTFLLFIILNVVIVFTWPIYIHYKFKNYHPYSSEIIEKLQMSKEDALQLYLETWIDRSFSYSQFLEHVESETKGKFVNISKKFGRKVENPNSCKKRFFFYGGSTTWGYNVADNQTIPAFFLESLKRNNYRNFCVFNFGGGSYFSTQENIRFQKHLIEGKINENDFIFFIDGMNESGLRKTRATDYLIEAFKPANEKFWNIYKITFPTFIKSLPIVQVSSRLLKRFFNLDLDANVGIAGSIRLIPEDLLQVYERNINIRKGICNSNKINCYSFLQPFATIHGVYFSTRDGVILKDGDKLGTAPEIGKLGQLVSLKQKYKVLKNAKGIVDISSALDSMDELSYVDAAHYSPDANKLIANRILKEIKVDLN